MATIVREIIIVKVGKQSGDQGKHCKLKVAQCFQRMMGEEAVIRRRRRRRQISFPVRENISRDLLD